MALMAPYVTFLCIVVEYFIFLFFFIISLAKPRGIAIPSDLEVEVQSLVSKSKLVLRHSRHWLSHRQRKDSVMLMSMSKNYRNIIEGLQVSVALKFICSTQNS